MADKPIRNFYLQNYEGQTKQLLGNTQSTPFLYTPGGLGIRFDLETMEYLNGAVIGKVTVDRPDITGTLVFETYEQHQELSQWILKSQGGINFDYKNPETYLKLFYITQEEGSVELEPGYFLVFLKEYEKTEKNADTGLLECPIVFQRLSNYRIPITIPLTNGLEPSEDITGTFPLPTNNAGLDPEGNKFIEFGTPSQDASRVRFGINYQGNMPVPVKFTIEGGYTYPTWTNSNDGSSGGYQVNTVNGTLEVNANQFPYMRHNGVDIYNLQDKYKKNYLYLYPGYNQITFNLGQTNIYTLITLEYNYERWVN